MTKSKHPEYNQEEVIDRLIKELRQKDKILLKIEELLLDDRTRELTVLGGIKYLFRTIDKLESENRKLSKELDRMVKKSK